MARGRRTIPMPSAALNQQQVENDVATAPLTPPSHQMLLWRAFKKHWFVYVSGVLVPLVLYGIFVGYPLVYSVYLSFMDWNGLSSHITFIGFANYSELFQDSVFWDSFTNTLRWIAGAILFADVIAFMLAAFLRSGRVYFGS